MGFTTNFFRDIIQSDPDCAAFREGSHDNKTGRPRTDNPHQGGQAHAQWLKGWDHAAQDQDYHAGWYARQAGQPQDTAQSANWQRGWQDFDDWAASQI